MHHSEALEVILACKVQQMLTWLGFAQGGQVNLLRLSQLPGSKVSPDISRDAPAEIANEPWYETTVPSNLRLFHRTVRNTCDLWSPSPMNPLPWRTSSGMSTPCEVEMGRCERSYSDSKSSDRLTERSTASFALRFAFLLCSNDREVRRHATPVESISREEFGAS